MLAEKVVPIIDTTEQVEQKSLTIIDQAKAVIVRDAETYTQAGALWSNIGTMIKEVKDTFDPICDAAHKAHIAATQKRAKYLAPLESAYRSVKALMSAYDEEQRLIAEREAERLRKEAEAIEAARRTEELRILEEERKAEEERLLQAAAEAESNGDKAQAEELLQVAEERTQEAAQAVAEIQAAPVYVPPIQVAKSTPKLPGGPKFSTVWRFEVTNANLIPREYLEPDLVKIGKVVTALQDKTNIPGVRAFPKRI